MRSQILVTVLVLLRTMHISQHYTIIISSQILYKNILTKVTKWHQSKFILGGVNDGEPKAPRVRRGGTELPTAGFWGGDAPSPVWVLERTFCFFFGVVCVGQHCQAKILERQKGNLTPVFLLGGGNCLPHPPGSTPLICI